MHGSSSSGPGKKARIEIIPLIDVVFFLLATFVLFTLSLNSSNGIPVTLPQTQTGEPRDPANSVTVSVTEGGTIAWNKDPVTLEEFIQKLQNYAATDPDPKVLIN
ncbi:MAG TPA: biopolymer transporter ExbD, partial [Opitutaceae bacterium]